MKLTTKMLKQIIKEEIESVIGESEFRNPGVQGKLDAENKVKFNKEKYSDAPSQRQYAAAYLKAKAGEEAEPAQAEIKPPTDDEMVGMEPMPEPMPEPDEYEPRSAGGVSAVAPGRGANPAQKSINKARTKIRMRRR